MSWFYLSFADPRKPTGEQFLGAAYVRASTANAAFLRSHYLQINPGGEIKLGGPIPDERIDERVSETDRERLLSRDELGQVTRWE